MSAATIDLRQVAPTLTERGHLDHAPEVAALSPLLLGAWLKTGAATRHCTRADGPCSNPWGGRCLGHNTTDDTALGDRIVIGRPGNPDRPRGVYRVTATGTAGVRLTREA